ncbi:polysaccharide pyruvyl transferase CsaB [Paratissierella segnis]|jgi:polysaccharide pyruvyl transferase CsaB|uniref:Polysaccharide pyruvyl transferase CsaB n=1 Tax=Paratissierella segnis TaxID=2763679 RepID=A0A926EUX7_9FIRM|nr:polysaccharide pyruvyl transferase CsaB [Paratissierella segnis]MBC8586924.1 polysaccharide pyruvyl transferase CsaB [Paratissierella segnis]
MKVLHLISGGDTGGAKTHIISLLKGLSNLIDAKVICFIEDTFYEDSKKAGINIEVYEQKSRSDLSVINRLTEEIKRENYSIIHCHGARANFIGMFLKHKINKPMVTTIHSDYKLDFKDNFYKRLVYTTLNKFALKRFNYYIAISDSFKEMLVQRGFKRDRIFVAYNGIDIENKPIFVEKDEFFKRYNIDYEGKLVVGILARLDLVKNHETFIRAAEKVLENRKDIIFLIAGEGNDEKRLKSLVKELKLEENIYFLGFVNDPYSFLNAIDINVLTSLSESFPYVILEGARMKKTIISTKVGGITKLIKDGYNGYLIDVGDEDKLANRIEYLSNNKEEIRILGENLFTDVKENHSYKSMAEEHLKIYRNILSQSETVLMLGYYGFDNSGDDAILKAIVKDLQEYNSDLNINVLSKDPAKTEAMYHVKGVNRFKFKEAMRAIKKSSIFISGGGSLLQDVTSTRSLLYYLSLMQIAKLYKKPVMIYANGIGPINRKINRVLTKTILNKVDLITLRDDDSRKYLEGMKVKNKNIYVTADPVFTLDPANESRINDILEIEGIPRDKNLVGISIRSWKGAENLVEIISKAIDYITKTFDVYVVLIPMHYPGDLNISIETLKMVKEGNTYVLENKYSVEELMGVIKKLDLIIAMRLHSLIYAATQSVPMVGLVYDPKVEGILNSLGMHYMSNVENLDYDELIYNIEYVWNHKKDLIEVLDRQDDILKDKALQNIHMAMDLLGR